MTDKKVYRKNQCPKCGSWDIWQTVSKPPWLICRKCGHEFVPEREDPTKPK